MGVKGLDTADPVESLERYTSREQHRLQVLQARKTQSLGLLSENERHRVTLKGKEQDWSKRYSKDLHASMLKGSGKFSSGNGSDGHENVRSAKKEIDEADNEVLRSRLEEKEEKLQKKLEEQENLKSEWREQYKGHRKSPNHLKAYPTTHTRPLQALKSKSEQIRDAAKAKREHRSNELRERWVKENEFLSKTEAEAQAELEEKKREHHLHEQQHLNAWKQHLEEKERDRERRCQDKERRAQERLQELKKKKRESNHQKWSSYNALLMKRHSMYMDRCREFEGRQQSLDHQHQDKDRWIRSMRQTEKQSLNARRGQNSQYYDYMKAKVERARMEEERRQQYFANKIERDDKLVDTIQKRKKALEERVSHLNHASYLQRRELRQAYESTWLNKRERIQGNLPSIKIDAPPIPEMPLPALDVPVPPEVPPPASERPARPMVRAAFNPLPNLGASLPAGGLLPSPPKEKRPLTAPTSSAARPQVA